MNNSNNSHNVYCSLLVLAVVLMICFMMQYPTERFLYYSEYETEGQEQNDLNANVIVTGRNPQVNPFTVVHSDVQQQSIPFNDDVQLQELAAGASSSGGVDGGMIGMIDQTSGFTHNLAKSNL